MSHPNAAVVREGFDRFVQGDVAGLVGLFADDAVWHVPGANAMAGDYRGLDEIIAFLRRTAEYDDRPLAVRLGSPAVYTADLRSAAGLPASGAGTRPALAGLSERLDRIRATPAARRMAPAARAARRFLEELRPAWWSCAATSWCWCRSCTRWME